MCNFISYDSVENNGGAFFASNSLELKISNGKKKGGGVKSVLIKLTIKHICLIIEVYFFLKLF